MKFSVDSATRRKVDDALTIIDLFDGREFKFDFVIAELDGNHPTVVNKVSDRVYYVLEGEGVVTVGSRELAVAKGELVTISSNTPHSIKGKLSYIVVTAPKFAPENERVVE